MLNEGKDRDEIVDTLGVKKSWLRAFLAGNTEVRDRWVSSNLERRRDTYREHFLELVRIHAGVPIKTVRSIPGNGVTWLYNNDREWLVAHLPMVQQARS
jgi:hypothetical protein